MRKIFYLLLVLLGLGVVACGSLYELEPVGIGRDYSELKKAPVLPDWLV